MTQLESISIYGFKSIKEVKSLPIMPLNVIIGPNGSGKSNFIGVFSFLNAIRAGRLRDYVAKAGGAERVLHFSSKVTSMIYIHISFNGGVDQYSIQLIPTANDELYPSAEAAYFWDKKKHPQPYKQIIHGTGGEAGIAEPQKGVAKHVQKQLDSWRLYHFHDTSATSPMKKTADINDNGFLRTDASNLAAFLYFLRERHPLSYQLIRHALQRVAPFIDDLSLAPHRLNPDKIRLEWRHKDSDAYFDASSLSDGTLRFLCLATLLLQPINFLPSVILIDEPELGLHPFAITLLASLMKSASLTSKVIVSTQSALLLDHFSPENVLVADRLDGSTQFTRLEKEPLADWLDEYSLGQLWEKNELGGRPGIG